MRFDRPRKPPRKHRWLITRYSHHHVLQQLDLQKKEWGDHGDLITSIQEQDKRTATMTQQIARLSTSVQNQLMQQVDVSTRTKAITSERLANRAATSAVAGPGVIVTLTDAPTPLGEVPKGFTIDDFVVHQQDVQAGADTLSPG